MFLQHFVGDFINLSDLKYHFTLEFGIIFTCVVFLRTFALML